MIMKIRNVNIDEIVTSFSYTKSIKIKKKKGDREVQALSEWIA